MRRYLFVNENIAGHRTVHANLAAVFAERPDVQVDILNIPTATGLRRLGAARFPPLDRWDADLQPLRAQILAAHWARRRISRIAEKYDAIHFYSHNAALLSTATMARVPSVVSSDSTNLLNASRIHGRSPSVFTPHAAQAARRVEIPVYRNARRLTPSSHWVARSLIDDYQVDPARIVVNPMGIRVPDLTAPTPTPSGGRLRIGFIGKPFDRKGGQWLLDLHANMWRDRADLLLITTSQVPASDGIEVVSDLTGGDPRLWSILGSCDVFAFPSAIDQAPNAVLEAMAAWLPVVALNVGAIPEMVIDGEAGFICEATDKQGFGEAVSRLLNDAELRRRMGTAARNRAATVYNMATCADRLLSILDDACWEPAG